MAGLRVLVVGASIAGPTAAYWLAKAGATVTVIERFPDLRTGGQNIDIRTVGLTVLRRMGKALAEVNSAKLDIEGFTLVDDNGKTIVSMKASGNEEQQNLVSEYEIFRGDLSRIIYGLTKDDPQVKYIFGDQVAAFHENGPGPVTVDFQSGATSQEFDLIVACDGSTSRTRAIALDCGVRDHLNILNTWAFYYSKPGDLLNGLKEGIAWNKTPGLFYSMLTDPVGKKTRISLMAMAPKNDEKQGLKFREAQKQGSERLKQVVAEHFASGGHRTKELLQALREADDFYATEIVQVKVPNLARGRFVLVGDAGYGAGPTGTGTSAAICGGYVLAGEIAAHPGNLEAGLKAYEDRMRPMLDDMQRIPPGIPGLMAPQTEWVLWLRNTVFVFASVAMRFSGIFTWLGGLFGGLWSAGLGSNQYGLPDYDFSAKKL